MQLNKQDEKLLQELLKKYKQGVISGLYQGTNITFTPTGCRDKIISSLGGSGGDSQTLSISSDILTISGGNSVTLPIGLFPNGYNFIDTDYVLQASDEGKLIIALAETPIHITVPTGSDVFTNKIIGIAMISSGDFEIEPSVAVNPLHQTNDGLGVGDLKCETVICQTFTGDGINSLSVLSTSVINDNGSYKTMLRYLYDKSGGGGTPAGSDTQVQYNNAGAFGADSGFTRDVATGNANLAKDVIQQSTVTFTGSGLDDLQIASTFSGSTPTTYTITISSTGTPDTFDWTDGTNSGTNVPMDVMGNALSNGLVIGFMADTGHTNGDSWSWTYTKPEKFAFKLTDDFGGNVGSGLAGVLQKYENTAGGINREARLGITELPGEDFGEFFPTIEQSVTDNATYSAYRVIVDGISDGYRDLSTNDNSLYMLRANSFSIKNTTFSTGSQNGISFINELGITATRIGNLFGGNGTKITIDDVNEHITISNLPAYDDDAAAGTAGLTAGMVYMTTGSGAAPLNAAGILMIKQ